jgi:hypothetical protein
MHIEQWTVLQSLVAGCDGDGGRVSMHGSHCGRPSREVVRTTDQGMAKHTTLAKLSPCAQQRSLMIEITKRTHEKKTTTVSVTLEREDRSPPHDG